MARKQSDIAKEARYLDKQKTKGYKQVKIWVPDELEFVLKGYAKALRDEYEGKKIKST